MYISWNWIREKIEIPSNFSPSILVYKLNYLGLECEENLDKESNELFINFTVYSNRRDLRSWWGIAREISILLGVKNSLFSDSKSPLKTILNNDFLIKIETRKVFSSDFVKIEINNNMGKTPQKIVSWLEKNKIKLINPIVDIANFATLETGQPFHIYDFDKIDSLSSQKSIIIRELDKTESFIDIHGKKRELSNGDVIISANEKIICLAGIIGDKETSITNLTRNILIESSSFDSHSIKETSQRNKIFTRSSEIFTKNFNQEFSLKALERIINVFQSNMKINSKFNSSISSRTDSHLNKTIIRISHNIIEKRLGVKIEKTRISEILKRLQFVYKLEDSNYLVEIPKFRIDIVIEEDLIEEIGKIFDYNNLKGRLPVIGNFFIDKKSNFKHNLRKKISLYLNSLGYQEVISYSLIDKNSEQDSTFVEIVSNSLSRSAYRKSFLASHLKILKENLKHGIKDISIFEIGNIYNKEKEIITESEIISLLSSNPIIESDSCTLHWLRCLIKNIFTILDLNDYSFLNEENDKKNLQEISQIWINKIEVGFFGKVENKILLKNDTNGNDCFFAQLSIDKLLEISFQKTDENFTSVSYLPIIKKDISFVVNKNIRIDDIISLIKKNGGEFFYDIFLFDKYEKNTECNKHSLAFRLSFQGKDKNLYKKEIEKQISIILNVLKREFLIKER